MKSTLFSALLFSALSLPAVPSLAQTISNTLDTGDSFNGFAIGQSFVAPTTENITKISVRPKANYSGTLYLYNGGVGSGMSAVGVPAYAQAGVSLPATPSNGPMQEIVLTTPFPVTAGNSYTFILEGLNSFFNTTGDTYPGGEVITFYGNTFPLPGFDLNFEIWTAAAPPPPPAPIPTMSQWGLILVSALLALFGMRGVRRRLEIR